jgi:protein-L-isoaspartate O-methyltransferase
LIGGKGGYINSVVAQVVGISGSLVTISSNSNILNVCRERVKKASPLAKIMEWKVIDDVTNPASILESFQQKFHAVIYCGAIKELPLLMGSLIADGGSLIAPVQVGDNQQFQMIIQETANKREIRKITDFGVIFEKAQ